MGGTEGECENSQQVSGPRFEPGNSRIRSITTFFMLVSPDHRSCTLHSSEWSVQTDFIVNFSFLNAATVNSLLLLEVFCVLRLHLSFYHTDFNHLLLRPTRLIFFVCMYICVCAFGLASVDLPPRIQVRECSIIFGHVRVACQPRAVSGTIGGYSKHCHQMPLHPPPPLPLCPCQTEL